MLGVHPKTTMLLQRRGPALPEGCLVGPPGGQDLKKEVLVLPGAVVGKTGCGGCSSLCGLVSNAFSWQ